MEDKEKINNIYDTPYLKRLLAIVILFFKLGVVNFGGGYALLPLLSKELVEKRGWTTDTDLADYYAIGQCTPGAIAVNVSTFIGYKIAGMLGGILATLSFVSPAFIIIFAIATLLTNFSDNPFVLNALAGINVVVFVLILSAIVKLSKKSIPDLYTLFIAIIVAFLAIFVKVIPLYVYVIAAALIGLLINILKDKKSAKIKPKEEAINDDISDKLDDNIITNTDLIPQIKDDKKESNLYMVLGLIIGLIFGFLAVFSFLFIKKKKYSEGVIATSFLWLIMAIITIISVIYDNYILFELYFNFFRIGICAFGGGLATLPFLDELGMSTGWFNQEDLAKMLAVSESTPGAMGINMSTYVGYSVGQLAFNNPFISFISSMISTLGLVSPSIIVIVIVSLFLKKFSDNKYVNYVFYGLRAASIGLICAAAYSVLVVSVFNVVSYDAEEIVHYNIITAFNYTKDYINANGGNFFSAINLYIETLINFKALGLGLLTFILVFKFKKHPVIYILFGALMGIILKMANCNM